MFLLTNKFWCKLKKKKKLIQIQWKIIEVYYWHVFIQQITESFGINISTHLFLVINTYLVDLTSHITNPSRNMLSLHLMDNHYSKINTIKFCYTQSNKSPLFPIYSFLFKSIENCRFRSQRKRTRIQSSREKIRSKMPLEFFVEASVWFPKSSSLE